MNLSDKAMVIIATIMVVVFLISLFIPENHDT